MRRYLSFAFLMTVLWLPAAWSAAAEPSTNLVYVIEIKDMIERGLVYVIRRGVKEAIESGADAIIFDMDTPGGRVDAAEKIVNIIGSSPVRTITFVNPNAISAGAIIAFATDDIYMAPGSRIGDAMPLMMSPVGAPQEIPGKIEEKAASYVSSLIRGAAQRNGHDENLAEAMVRPEIGYTIGDKVICPTNQLLTLTNAEAEQLVVRNGVEEPLLSRGTVQDRQALLEKLGLSGAVIKELAVSPAEKVARIIESFSALLLIGGLLGLYIEFKTPGFGLPGITGILLLGIWFWGHHVAGLAGMGHILVFLLGVTLLGVEIFVIPGFGFVGMTGIGLIFASLFMAMAERYPGGPWYPSPKSVEEALTVLGISLLATTALALILGRLLPHTPAYGKLVLGTSVGASEGYQASAPSTSLLGRNGVAESDLHPSGIGVFDGERLDVLTRGDYIKPGTPITIVEAQGSRLVVEARGAGSDAASQGEVT